MHHYLQNHLDENINEIYFYSRGFKVFQVNWGKFQEHKHQWKGKNKNKDDGMGTLHDLN